MKLASIIDHELMPWAFAGPTPMRTWLAAQFIIRYVRAFPR